MPMLTLVVLACLRSAAAPPAQAPATAPDRTAPTESPTALPPASVKNAPPKSVRAPGDGAAQNTGDPDDTRNEDDEYEDDEYEDDEYEDDEYEDDEDDERWLHGQLKINILGKVGASAAHVWNIPTVGAAPGGGVRGRARLGFGDNWRLSIEGGANFGGADDGSGVVGTLGSYQFALSFGYRWFDFDWVNLWSEPHIGVQSLSYIPVPTWGVETTVTFIPVRIPHFSWEISGSLDIEAYVIAPSASPSILTGVYTDWWGGFMGVEAAASAQVIVAVVANSAAANAQIRWVGGYAF